MRRARARATREEELDGPLARRVLRDGEVVDETYRVSKLIAAGGMGEVYEVVHTRLERAFALKCLRAETLGDQRAAKRFLREMRSLAGVRSEHVVAINDCGELADGAPYLVMERLSGQNLRELLKEAGSLVPPRAVALILDACLGLGAVHQTGLIHRDLKPENLYVTRRDSGEESCTVLDFGIATRPGNNSTRRESLLGTLRYMAPEQIADSTRAGTWTDVYALGAILYECLCGHPPHEADTEAELMFKIMNTDVSPLDSEIPDFPEALSRVVQRTLARDPSERYQTVEQLSLALTRFRSVPSTGSVSESVETRPVGVPQGRARPGPLSRRSIVGVTAVASFAAGWVSSSSRPEEVARSAPPSAAVSAAPATVTSSRPKPAGPTTTTATSATLVAGRQSEPPVAAAAAPVQRIAPALTGTARRKPAAESKKKVAEAPPMLPELDPSPYHKTP